MASQLTKEFLRKGEQCEKNQCYKKSDVAGARNDLADNSDIDDEKSEYRRFLNEKSKLVGTQQLSPNEIGWPGQGFKSSGYKLYKSGISIRKHITNMILDCK